LASYQLVCIKSYGVLSHCKKFGAARFVNEVIFVTLLLTFFNDLLNPLVYITRYDVLRRAWIDFLQRMKARLRNEQPPPNINIGLDDFDKFLVDDI